MSTIGLEKIPLREAASRLMELAEEVVAGTEKVFTMNGTAIVALVDAKRLDYYHELERKEGRRSLMLADAEQGIKDAHEGRVTSLK